MNGSRIIEGAVKVPARFFGPAAEREVEDALVEEGPLQIVLDGSPYSVTMRTPGDDLLLAQGLLFTEGVLTGRTQVKSAKVLARIPGKADSVAVERVSAPESPGSGSGRRLISNASCGVCGLADAEDLKKPVAREHRLELDMSLLPVLADRMRAGQSLFHATGGCHAAAIFDVSGKLLTLKEDVGRHNAVDKAIGHLFQHGTLPQAAILFVSGRVSYEIVTKASRAGVAFLAAVSAPSSLAVELCAEAGITLIGFCRGEKATVYSHPEAVRTGVHA